MMATEIHVKNEMKEFIGECFREQPMSGGNSCDLSNPPDNTLMISKDGSSQDDEDEIEICTMDEEDDNPNTDLMLNEEVDHDYEDEENIREEVRTISSEERFERLTLLLQKSQIYADSLLKVIEKRKEIERKKAIKREKKKLKSLQNQANAVQGTKLPDLPKKRRVTDDVDSSKHKRKKADECVSDFLLEKIYFPQGHEIVNQLVSEDGRRYFKGSLVSETQPVLFTGGILRDYQIKGFLWLKVLFTNAINGILADEMGLGKTIQCIALLCHVIKSGFKGPFLIGAPMSTVSNWMNEFKTFAPSIPLLLYHGTRDERKELERYFLKTSDIHGCHPVVISTYDIILRDANELATVKWEYMILDEGHRIKNSKCKLLARLHKINVESKLLLTGTPLQNNLRELWSLLNFLIPEVFDDLQVFESWFDFTTATSCGDNAMSLEQEQNFLSKMYQILTPFLLRRVKEDVELELPRKTEIIVYAPFSKKQEQFYNAAVNRTIRQVLGDSTSTTKSEFPALSDITNYPRITRKQAETLGLKPSPQRKGVDYADINISLNNVIMLLRKCCNHPYLLEYPLVPGTEYYRVDEDIVSTSGKFMILDQLLPKLKKRGHKVLIFSQMVKMLDIIEDYLRYRNYTCVRLDGQTTMSQRQQNIDNFNSDKRIFIFLLSTRAGGLGINLTAADTVIIYDSDWNPQNDLQAQDRCHRIGQTNPVVVYRLVTSGSVDQQMLERATAKRRLERLVMHRDKFKGNLDIDLKAKMKVGKQEIIRMLQSADIQTVVNYKKALSKDELEKLLDRSSLFMK